MSSASLIVALSGPPAQVVLGGKEMVTAHACIAGSQPVNIVLAAQAGTACGDALLTKKQDDLLIASGGIQLDEEGNTPLITASVICDAHPDQYLNEVVVVGRVGGDVRMAESGKSACRSIAVNRYHKPPDAEEPVEETDWYPIRGFGLNRDKLERVGKGALLEISGILSQMTSANETAYCEVRARNIRIHKAGAAGNPAAGTNAVGYDQDAFNGDDGIGLSADWA